MYAQLGGSGVFGLFFVYRFSSCSYELLMPYYDRHEKVGRTEKGL
jgi:hypothetical protein